MAQVNTGLDFIIGPQMPSTFEVLETLRARSEQARLRQEQAQLRAEGRRAALNQYVGKNLDETDYEGVLQQNLAALKGKYAQLLTQPGAENMTTADLQVLMSKDLSKLSRWNQLVKQGTEAIKAQAQDFKGTEVNKGTLEKAALHNFLYKKTPEGGWALKNPEELDVQQNWVESTLEQTPEFFVDTENEGPLTPKSSEAYAESGEHTFQGPRGGKVSENYRIKYFPEYQRVVKPAAGRPYVERAGEPLTGQDGKPLTTKEGQPIMVATMGAFKKYLSDPDQRLRLLARFKQQEGRVANVKNEGDVDILRAMVYERLPQQPAELDFDTQKKADPIPMRVLFPTVKAEKQAKVTPVDYLLGAMSGSQEALSVMAAQPDGTVNAAPAMGGWKFIDTSPDGKGRPRALNKVIFDPTAPERGVTIGWVVEGEAGSADRQLEKHLSLPEFKKFLRQSYPANSGGDNMRDVNKILDAWFKGDKLRSQKAVSKPPAARSFMDRLSSFFNSKP